ncbi:MAG: class I SAM-dependent methyltransferase [Candidatus Hodarchaeota archaeon]
MKKYIDANRKRWDELAEVHYKGEGYNVKEFIKGCISIGDIELHEVGDVKEKQLLHLQCHFGKDTLSWARLGAIVTGVDFSSRAIELANQLRSDTGLKATFILSEISKLDQSEMPPSSFDIVILTIIGSFDAYIWRIELFPESTLRIDSVHRPSASGKRGGPLELINNNDDTTNT